MKILRTILQDIRNGQNLDIYILIIISIAVAIFGIFQVVDQIVISATVLAMLALVANSLLQNRRTTDALQQKISGIESGYIFGPELADYYHQNEALSHARTAFFWGITFERLIPHVQSVLEPRLQTGLQARFLLLKPGSNAVKMAAFRERDGNETRINNTINMSIEKLTLLAQRATKPASLEIRVVDYLPPWSMVAFDPKSQNGSMFISLLPFRPTIQNRPTFQLNAKEYGYWISSFKKQFEELWQEAEPLNPMV